MPQKSKRKPYFFFSLFLLLLLIGCSESDDTVAPSAVQSCKLHSVDIQTLVFDDIDYSVGLVSPQKLIFEYDAFNRIINVKGGLYRQPAHSGFDGWFLIPEAEDVISYPGNVIKVEHTKNFFTRPYDKEFIIEDDQLVSRKTSNVYPPTIVSNFTYEYNGNQIIEKREGTLFRTFTMENGNLIKVEQIIIAENNTILGKKEFLFSDYDNNPNLLKGKFYINGALFKAFSLNNYRHFEYNEYTYVDGTYEVGSYLHYNLYFDYDEQGIPTLFEQDCP